MSDDWRCSCWCTERTVEGKGCSLEGIHSTQLGGLVLQQSQDDDIKRRAETDKQDPGIGF